MRNVQGNAAPRVLAAVLLAALPTSAQPFAPAIPKFWDDREVESFEVPLANPRYSPRHMSSAEYYSLKVRPIYKTYPVYATGREPAGYREHLKTLEPEIIFDPAKLRSEADWVAAGKVVFESEPLVLPAPEKGVLFPTPLPPNADGTLPFFVPGARYIIRKKGVLEVGINACAGCHTRVMPDGSYLRGAQGAFDFPASAEDVEKARNRTPELLRAYQERSWILYGAPWVETKESYFARLTKEAALEHLALSRPGILPRQGTSEFAPPHIPSLIGLRDRRFLDATGFARHRNIGDLARYAITNQGLDTLAHYGDFQPSDKATAFSSEMGTRYSDEQLYALALYIYSLQPPPNPNKPNPLSGRGEKIFVQQGCAGCHPAPHYTNNKLTPAKGFAVPEEMKRSGDVLNVSVGTDPTLALRTRRGTGFYKVPSLRGVWYRNAFGHGGWVDTLEEWLDPARLKPDFVPKNRHAPRGPVPGHEFGLKLAAGDRAALIAFLKTL
ncbi:MAG: hypothetical protein JNM66_25535 [Bryobacterales bacterium]|nr:hypothetical protein [Bryobacterales bacterium]